MRIGIPKEPLGQNLVSASPDSVAKFLKLGYEVCVEHNAGEAASYFDKAYEEAGATIVDRATVFDSDIVVCLDTPPLEDMKLMHKGATLIARMNPFANEAIIEECHDLGITALAMDAVPRISRAQSMDVRSSMQNIAGYRAVIEAASAFGRLFTGQVTAAGKMPPAKVYIIGVGVTGLAAMGTANSMGAIVSATDVRADVADQVESLGATFIEIPVKQESSDGYAKEMTDEQQQQVLEVYTREAAKNDIVITTAQIPGKPAPLLITKEAVAAMAPGSVIVDMGASPLGGNCELSKPNEVVVTDNGVTIIGYTDLANRLPAQASQLYGQNIVNFLKLVTPEKDGVLQLDENDEVVRGVTVTLDGAIMWPPPPVSVSAAPKEKPAEVKAESSAVVKEASAKTSSPYKGLWWKILAALAGVLLILAAPESIRSHFIVFELAVVVGFYVITNVTHTLHTPLMSVTNAISGIIIIGALILINSDNIVVMIISFIAMAIAAINIFGGFLVTNRMLEMFNRSSDE